MIYYDMDGNLITREEWAALMEDPDYRFLARTEVGENVVSTVWLGLDHSFGEGLMPLIFETMVFPRGTQQRYMTKELALEGHEKMVTRLKRYQPGWGGYR